MVSQIANLPYELLSRKPGGTSRGDDLAQLPPLGRGTAAQEDYRHQQGQIPSVRGNAIEQFLRARTEQPIQDVLLLHPFGLGRARPRGAGSSRCPA